MTGFETSRSAERFERQRSATKITLPALMKNIALGSVDSSMNNLKVDGQLLDIFGGSDDSSSSLADEESEEMSPFILKKNQMKAA